MSSPTLSPLNILLLVHPQTPAQADHPWGSLWRLSEWMPVNCLAWYLDHGEDSLCKWPLLSDLIMSFLLEAFIWFPQCVQNEVQIPKHSIQDPQWSESHRPWTFSAYPCPTWFLPLGMRFSILPVATCPLRPGANTISMKHFLIHLVVINHLFSWAPIGFNLYFHPTPFCPLFVLVSSVIKLASTREWTHNTNTCLNCWIQDMLATSNRKYVMGQTQPTRQNCQKDCWKNCICTGPQRLEVGNHKNVCHCQVFLLVEGCPAALSSFCWFHSMVTKDSSDYNSLCLVGSPQIDDVVGSRFENSVY